MASFRDRAGREWQLTLSVAAMRAVKMQTGFDLARMFTPEAMTALADDPGLMVDVLWVLVAEQRPKDMAEEDFAAVFDGDALEAAEEALTAAAIDFLPRSRRALMSSVRDKAQEITRARMELVQSRLAELTLDDLLPPQSSGPK